MATDPVTLAAAGAAAPQLDALSTVSAASAAATPKEAVGNARAAAAYGTATKTAAGLASQSADVQTNLGNGFTASQLAQLHAVGYVAPRRTPQPAKGGGGWSLNPFSDVSRVAGDVGSVLKGGSEELLHGAGTAVSDVLGAAEKIPGVPEVLGALNKPLAGVQHIFRAVQYMSEQSSGLSNEQLYEDAQKSGVNLGNLHEYEQLFDPSSWASAWDATGNTKTGDGAFDPGTFRYLQGQATNKLDFNLAVQVARGIDQQTIVNSYAPQERSDVIGALNSKSVQDTATILSNSKMTVGQMVVGSKLLTDHPSIGHKISGAIDALTDILSDPTNMAFGGVTGGAFEKANYGITGEEAAALGTAGGPTAMHAFLSSSPGASRYIQTVGKIIEDHGLSYAERYDPRLLKMANRSVIDGTTFDGLAEAGVHDADSLRDYLASAAGIKNILEGRAAQIVGGGDAIIPHLSQVGRALMLAKGHLSEAIDWASDNLSKEVASKLPDVNLNADDLASLTLGDTVSHLAGKPSTLRNIVSGDVQHPMMARVFGSPLRGAGGAARMVKQMTTLTAAGNNALDLLAPDAAVSFKRILSYTLPKHAVDTLTDAFTAATTTGEKFAIYKGAVDQMLQMTGLFDTQEGSTLGAAMMDTLDDSFRKGKYGPGGYDDYADGTSAGLLDNQLNHYVMMPSYKAVRQAAVRGRFYRQILGQNTFDMADKAMAMWKAGVLMRPGFAIRVSTDEVMENIFKNGVSKYLVARRLLTESTREAKDVAAQEAKDALGDVAPEDRTLAHQLAAYSSHIPSHILALVKKPIDLTSAAIAYSAKKYLTKTGQFTDQEMLDAAHDFQQYVWEQHLAPQLSSLAHGGGGYDTLNDEGIKWLSEGKTIVPLKVRRMGPFKEVMQDDPMYLMKMHVGLSQIASSKMGQTILEHIHEPFQGQVRAVEDFLRSDDMADLAPTSRRMAELPDGREVGVDATQDDAIHDWAQKAVRMVNHAVRSDDPINGPVMNDVVRHMRMYEAPPEVDELAKIPRAELPHSTWAPDYAPISDMRAPEKAINSGFDHLSKMIDWMSRQPMTLQAFMQARKDLSPFVDSFLGDDASDLSKATMLNEMAANRAFEALKPFIHDPAIKSQFELIHRTAMPFLFAQEQFLKRWTKTLIDSPDAIRKAQLTMNGLRTSGTVYKNSSGEWVFNYPLVPQAMDAITGVMHALGMPISTGIPVNFTGQVLGFMPGLENPLTPSVGPSVTLSLKALTNFFPEMNDLDNQLLGAGASEGWLSQVLPATVYRAVTTATGSANGQSEFASAMVKAIQEMAASGHGLSQNANAQQTQVYINRLQNWTRVLFTFKTVLGAAAPASPVENFDSSHLSDDLQALMNELPYDQAISTFLAEHPNATPYTVFASKTQGDVPDLPSTNAAYKFTNDNLGFMEKFPQAAGWFIPRVMANGTFNSALYREQIQMGMRDVKLPAQFLQDVQMAPAASEYDDVVQQYEKLYNATTSGAQHSQLTAQYDAWKATFMAQNPVYAEYIAGGGSAPLRSTTLRQIEQAVQSPDAPKGTQTDNIRTVLSVFYQYEAQYAGLNGQYTQMSTFQKNALEQQMTAWGTAFIKANPDVSDFWNVMIVPELGTSAINQGVG